MEATSSPRSSIPLLLSIAAAAKMLGVGQRTLRAWISEGRLKVTYLGPRTPRILDSDLVQFIERARGTAESGDR